MVTLFLNVSVEAMMIYLEIRMLCPGLFTAFVHLLYF
jgi:hypothetical protein